MKFSYTMIVLICLKSNIYSQTGPGGVGNTLGTSALKIWLKGEDIDANPSTVNPANGTAISLWKDFSGNSFNFGNTSTTNSPAYDNSIFPSVFFNANSTISAGNTQYLNNQGAGVTPSSFYYEGSAFVAAKHILVNNSIAYFDNSNYSLRLGQWPGTSKLGYTAYGIGDYVSSITPVSTNSITSFHKLTSASSVSIWHNNNSTNLTIGSSSYGMPYGRMGASSTVEDRISGNMFECILYNSPVNSAQQIIIDNYLSSKYNSIPIMNDIYVQDNSTNGNFDYDLAGIGRMNSSNLHSDSRGTGIVQINNPTNLGDDEYLIWGHNDSARAHLTQTNDVPAGVIRRWKRVWRVNEVSLSGAAINVGNIDMTFDLTGYGPVMQSHLRLLVDVNNNGIFSDDTPIGGAALVTGNLYKFTGVSAIANNLRFTLGTTNIGTPLPVELTNFQLDCVKNTIAINWETASERNNHYFTLYRSIDAIHWDSISRIEGAGNSLDITKYQIIDSVHNESTLYYKLRQTDFEGRFEEFSIKSIKCALDNLNCSIKVYPNPMENFVNIETCWLKLEKLEWLNSEGQIIERVSTPKENKICTDKILASGLYILKLYYDDGSIQHIKITRK